MYMVTMVRHEKMTGRREEKEGRRKCMQWGGEKGRVRERKAQCVKASERRLWLTSDPEQKEERGLLWWQWLGPGALQPVHSYHL